MADDQLFQRFGKEFPAGAVLFAEGEPGREMYVVQQGRVTISKKVGDVEKILTSLGPGEFLGEMSFLNNKPRSATATCAEASRLLVIDARTFETMVRSNAEIAIRMIKKLADRLQEANEQIENLLFADAPFREELVTRRGKALEAGARAFFLRRGGGLVFYSAALPYRREKTAFRLVDETIARLGQLDWLTDEAVASARRRLERGELDDAYWTESRALAIGTARWWHGDDRIAAERAVRIAAVTRADVERVWKQYVSDAEPVRVYATPERVPWYVRLFGWIWPLVN